MRRFNPILIISRGVRVRGYRDRSVAVGGTGAAPVSEARAALDTATVPLTREQFQKLIAEHESKLQTDAKKSAHSEPSRQQTTKKDGKVHTKASTAELQEPVTIENQYHQLTRTITPLAQVPYLKQLTLKENQLKRTLRSLSKQLKTVHASFEKCMHGLPCPLEGTRPSPELIGYRNKDEFSINVGADGDPKTVGFYVGRPADPGMVCVPPSTLINVRPSHKHIAQSFQNFIRQSPHAACHRLDHGGIWRNLVVRSTQRGEKMATVYIHPQQLPQDDLEEIMNNLKHYFFSGEGAECELDSLYLQACKHTRCSREQAPYTLIQGKQFITETCQQLSFEISPDSFFQINTKGAEVLYNTVQEIAEVSPLTTVLDVCCGTGTISLIMAPHVRGTIGIDVTSGAIEDAKRNSAHNGIRNATFFTGKAEKVLPVLLRDLRDCTDVVAVVNPARAGLHPDIIRTLRRCESINKLIYISCKPEGYAMSNFVKLCSTRGDATKKDKSTPFSPRYAVPVDMFPHTNHIELVLLFERVQS